MRGIFSHYVARKSKLYWSTLGLEKYVTHVSCLNRSPKEAGALKKFEKLKPRGQMDGKRGLVGADRVLEVWRSIFGQKALRWKLFRKSLIKPNAWLLFLWSLGKTALEILYTFTWHRWSGKERKYVVSASTFSAGDAPSSTSIYCSARWMRKSSAVVKAESCLAGRCP